MMQNHPNRVISPRTKDLIDLLMLGKFSLAEIAKVTGVSEQWLQIYVDAKYEFVPTGAFLEIEAKLI